MRKAFRSFNWPAGTFIIIYHALLVLLLPSYLIHSPPKAGLALTTLVLITYCGIGIGVYHRYYAHRAYTLHPIAEIFFLIGSTLALESSVLRWAHDHRKHHKHLDTPDDPYSITRGFWHAHILWIFEKQKPMDGQIIRDLIARKLLLFQHQHYALLTTILNLTVWVVSGLMLADFYGAFVMCLLVRIFIVHHATWFVNSLAHTFGERSYSHELSAVDNYILAFFTFGEGYHNFHHVFPSDYRNGVRWYHFDPNKWVVWALGLARLAGNLKRSDRYTIKRKLLQEDQRLLTDDLAALPSSLKADFERRARRLAARMEALINALHQLSLRERGNPLPHVRRKIKQLRKRLRLHERLWSELRTAVPARAAA